MAARAEAYARFLKHEFAELLHIPDPFAFHGPGHVGEKIKGGFGPETADTGILLSRSTKRSRLSLRIDRILCGSAPLPCSPARARIG